MKKNKQLDKSIKILLDSSFKDGSIIESKVIRSIKILKSMSKYLAIEALSKYLLGLKRIQREHTLYIETTVPLSIVQLKKVQKVVEKKAISIGKSIKITKVITSINPEILGVF